MQRDVGDLSLLRGGANKANAIVAIMRPHRIRIINLIFGLYWFIIPDHFNTLWIGVHEV